MNSRVEPPAVLLHQLLHSLHSIQFKLKKFNLIWLNWKRIEELTPPWLALALIKEIQEFLYGAARPTSPLKRRAKPAFINFFLPLLNWNWWMGLLFAFSLAEPLPLAAAITHQRQKQPIHLIQLNLHLFFQSTQLMKKREEGRVINSSIVFLLFSLSSRSAMPPAAGITHHKERKEKQFLHWFLCLPHPPSILF